MDFVVVSVQGLLTDAASDYIMDSFFQLFIGFSRYEPLYPRTVRSVPVRRGSAPVLLISIILNDKSLHDIFQSDIDGWKELYPAVDILQELNDLNVFPASSSWSRKTITSLS